MNIFEVADEHLFSGDELYAVLEGEKRRLRLAIEAYEGAKLLNTPPADLATYFAQKFALEPARLQREAISVTKEESRVDVSLDNGRFISDRSRPFYIPASLITFHVPFVGDPHLFTMRPSSITTTLPTGAIVRNELQIAYHATPEAEAQAVKTKFESDLAQVASYLEWVERDVEAFNATLERTAREVIDARRTRLLQSQDLVASLGFPLKHRVDAPATFAVPDVRRKVVPAPPQASSKPFVPEPALAIEQYESILDIIRNMVHVMEQSPRAFETMGEEDLRTHFLVQLNGQFEGRATGETFNYDGKTDILIREEGRNIFIAECKFWDGPKSLQAAIDQVLGYASWRDTKLAIVAFNRQAGFTDVLAKIPEAIQSHANFKKDFAQLAESDFRAVLRNRDDEARELILTVLAFDVPCDRTAKGASGSVSRGKKAKKK